MALIIEAPSHTEQLASPDFPLSGGRLGWCDPPNGLHARGVRAAHALDRGLARRVAVQLDDEDAAVAVTQLLGDHPWLELQDVEHVAGAEVAELVEVHAVLIVDGEALVQVVTRGELRHGRGADGRPRPVQALLTDLPAALGAEHQVVAEAARLVYSARVPTRG